MELDNVRNEETIDLNSLRNSTSASCHHSCYGYCLTSPATCCVDGFISRFLPFPSVRLQYSPPLIPPRGEVNAADAFDIGSFDEEDTKGIKVKTPGVGASLGSPDVKIRR